MIKRDRERKRERERACFIHHITLQIQLTHLILSIDLSFCCQQFRDQSHSTVSTSEVKRSPSILNTNEMITTLLHSSHDSELQLEPQQRGAQSRPPHDLDRKHDGGESFQTEEDKSTRITTTKPDLEHRLELQLSTTQSRLSHDLQSRLDGGESFQTEEDKSTRITTTKPDLEHRFELQLSTTQSPLPHDLQSKHDGGESIQTKEDKSTRITTVQTSSSASI
jgi:hypothetical protein